MALSREARRVELRPHSAEWGEQAAVEAARVAGVLGDGLIAIHHVGSTAVPGILAKPILDLLPEVRTLAVLDRAAPRLEALGYEWRGEFGIAGRRYCTWDDPATGARRVHLHGFAAGHPEAERMLAFRDYLRAHPEVARAYEAEKIRCRALHADDTTAYAEAKTEWIRTYDAVALAFRRARHP